MSPAHAKHIGIAAVSAEGAALCYRTICAESAAILGPHDHPQITMHTYPLSEYMRQVEADRWEDAARILQSSARKLVDAGAEILICPDNTLHQAIRRSSPRAGSATRFQTPTSDARSTRSSSASSCMVASKTLRGDASNTSSTTSESEAATRSCSDAPRFRCSSQRSIRRCRASTRPVFWLGRPFARRRHPDPTRDVVASRAMTRVAAISLLAAVLPGLAAAVRC
jgi:hypothetical protein